MNALENAACKNQRLSEGQRPIIIEVGSEVDREFLTTLKEARGWLPKVVTYVESLRSLTGYLEPFPVFKSSRLQTTQDGRVVTRELITLRDNCIYDAGSLLLHPYDVSAHLCSPKPSHFQRDVQHRGMDVRGFRAMPVQETFRPVTYDELNCVLQRYYRERRCAGPD